ncbi:Protein kinase-like (PK-like) [Apiospora saccharicola]|uniref:Protein kinase-like (PK-like) n=1 Tax=Apiospora saccharicola TaxID=335842 RepID=A0ABR1THL7_9PEZI
MRITESITRRTHRTYLNTPQPRPDMTLPLHNPQYPDYARQYDAAYQKFRTLRDLCTRKTHDGLREFALVDSLTRRLQAKPEDQNKSYLQCLLVHSTLSCGVKPPGLLLEELEHKYIRIFYILVDLGCPQLIPLFSAKGLNDNRLPMNLASIQEIEIGDDYSTRDDFHRLFLEKQYFWCPMIFDSDEGQYRGNQIIPICFREKIDTQRGRNVLSHSGAILWKIAVPEECVAPRVREKIEDAKVERHIGIGDNYDEACYYQLALKQFSMSNKDKFWKERDTANSLKKVYGVVQYFTWYQEGEGDEGPSQPFLNLVLELGEMDLYKTIRTRAPPVLRGEIKGIWESMFDISFALQYFHGLEIENTRFNACHGDIKPENILFVNDRFKLGDSGEATIEVDTASTTWMTQLGGTKTYASPEKYKPVLGSSQGASRQGRADEDIWSLGCVFSVVATWIILGADGVTQYSKVRQKARQRRVDIISDSFHDDNQVLPEVTAWHDYLRAAARQTDKISSRVLNLVDNYMLVGADSRKDATFIIKGFADHLSPDGTSDTGLPEEIGDILMEIEQEEIAQERHGPLSEELLCGYDAAWNRWAVGPLGYGDSDSASARELLSRHTMPTVQRLPQHKLRPSGSVYVPARTDCSESDDEVSLTPMPSAQYNIPHTEECDAPVSLFTLEKEIDDLQGGIWTRITRRNKSIRERKQAANDDELKDFFDNRDIIFLIDNAPSMAQHWKQVMFSARVLLRRVMDYDDDGIEMYFSQGDRKVQVKQKPRQKITNFEKAMKSVTPDPNSDPLMCCLPLALQYIFMESIRKPEKKHQTIFVFTDGIWEGGNESGVESVIKSHMQKMGWCKPEVVDQVQEQKPLSIEFIQFGHDPNGTLRLRHLDNDLVQEGYPDLIDTEPAAGDANKMILGSLDKAIDESRNTVNSFPSSIATPTSPNSPRPGSFGPYGAAP